MAWVVDGVGRGWRGSWMAWVVAGVGRGWPGSWMVWPRQILLGLARVLDGHASGWLGPWTGIARAVCPGLWVVARAVCPGRPWSGRRGSSGSSVGFVGAAGRVGEPDAAVADALFGQRVEVFEGPAAVVDVVMVVRTQQAQVP